MRGFSIELLKESPSSLRASTLAQKYPPLAQELFNVAFCSCWCELHDKYQDDLLTSLEATCHHSRNIPVDIMLTLLRLCEFMEQRDKALPISVSVLADLERCGAFSKALYYRELEFVQQPSQISTLESLISLNNTLGLHEAAQGILFVAQQQQVLMNQANSQNILCDAVDSKLSPKPLTRQIISASPAIGRRNILDNSIEEENNNGSSISSANPLSDSSSSSWLVAERWYEKLDRWEDALEAYEHKQIDLEISDKADNKQKLQVMMGRVRCCAALSDWQRVHVISSSAWDRHAED